MQTTGAPRLAVDASRRRTVVLWALVAAFTAPLVVGPLVSLGLPGSPVAIVAAGLVAHVAALVAAAVAAVRWPPRVAVVLLALLGLAAGLPLVLRQGSPSALVLSAAVLSSILGPLLLPALARLGQAVAGGINPQLDRAWHVSWRLTLTLGVALAVLHLGALVSYGALYRAVGGVPVALAVTAMLSGAAAVAGWHAAVCALRSHRALAGTPPGPLRPWLLAVLLVLGAVLGLVGVLVAFA